MMGTESDAQADGWPGRETTIPLFYSAPASVLYLGRALVTRGEAVYRANPASRMMERCGRDASIE